MLETILHKFFYSGMLCVVAGGWLLVTGLFLCNSNKKVNLLNVEREIDGRI
jgi:hypothetical protein